MPDPNPVVDGQGAGRLADAGVRVRGGLMRASSERLNRGYLSRVQRGRPWVRLKIAASLDGATAMASGESQWITGEAARADVQRLRAGSSAILTGIGTVLADDPSLNVRDASLATGGRQPTRVVLDSTLRTPPAANLLKSPGEVLIYGRDPARQAALRAAGAEVVIVDGDAGRIDPGRVLDDLGRRGSNTLLLECGPRLAGSFMTAGLVDELVIYLAPHMMGGETRGMLDTPHWRTLSDRQPLDFVDVRKIGGDLRITAQPISRP